MTNAKRRLLYSIRAKLAAYSQKRGLDKLEALNEALDRALSVERADIDMKALLIMIEREKICKAFLAKYIVKENRRQLNLAYYNKNKVEINKRTKERRELKKEEN